MNGSRPDQPTRTFEEASAEIQANLQKYLEKQQSIKAPDSSDESSGDEEAVDAEDDRVKEILEKVFQSYSLDGANRERTGEAIRAALKRGLNSCLICIGSIRKNDPIWNCEHCCCSFHINCIQRWGKDSVFQQKQDLELNDAGGKRTFSIVWACPNCRQTYPPAAIPTRYTCYCSKVVDPPFDPWCVPHSCGDPCGRRLRPDCGHQCLILCHPGPCPPCPKVVTTGCHCGKSAPSTRRCHDKEWSCGKACAKLLNCGQHPCPKPCHAGDCPPCEKVSVQLCKCRRHQKECRCANPVWQCDDKCGRKQKCENHFCDIVCHDGTCPPCPLSEIRHCPCGKSTHQLPCTLATPTCGDTCGKTLVCGDHVCAERCHRGTCPPCMQMVTKTCRCGNKRRDITCSKDYACEVKCKNLRDCRKHACNRKCCDKNCPQCEQTCSKLLNCKNHKCESRCHAGPCYPCTQTKEVSCNCGVSRVTVPCGVERSIKPPKCRERCANPPDCHHEAREAHNCHFGDCPPCKQVCDRSLQPCSHTCPAPCHDQVKVKIEEAKKAATPWEAVGPRIETRAVQCPACETPVPVTCLGAHETSDWPCHAAKTGSCGRSCGRSLACGNHTCSRDCHKVKNAPNDFDAGSNCRKCESGCLRPRPKGCGHACKKPCHSDDCEPCGQMIRIACHCNLAQLYVKCGEWNRGDVENESEKEGLACCQNQCPKTMACGHRCSKTCHPGECSDPSTCKKRSKVYCPCKRRKEEQPCAQSSSGNRKLACDPECKKVKEKAVEEKQSEDRWLKEEEERLARVELERFEKQSGESKGKRRRARNRHSETVEASFLARHKIAVIFGIISAAAASAALLYFR